MRNVATIALREFLATVATRAFVVGLLIVPVLIGIFALIAPRLVSPRGTPVEGDVMLIDRTGRVARELEYAFDPETIAARRSAETRRALASVPEGVRSVATSAVGENFDDIFGLVPTLKLVEGAPDTDLDEGRQWLSERPGGSRRLALVVIHADAVEPPDGSLRYGSFDIYVPPDVDDGAISEIRRGLREAIVSARLEARALDRDTIDAIVRVPSVRAITVGGENQRAGAGELGLILPLTFGVLLLIGVMGGGGQLLTTMVEEKSSRVVEVLLSAVSPMELMAGKLLGQMAVSLVGMSLYLAMGMAALASFALFGLLDVSLIFYLLIFFVITYLVMGSLMMAVGSAVNDMREAQGLLMPLMMVFTLPWFLWWPIARNPDSLLSVTVSFLPPLNTFGMLLRMASNNPPPFWQVWLSIGIGVLSVVAAVWLASKVFRIGILMYGKPPSIGTLIRWVRAA